MRPALPMLAGCLAILTALGGCSVIEPADERQMTVYFPRARSFFAESKVKIMGADVGRVDRVRNMGDRIRVDFHIEGDIPLPRGVHASIVPLNLVGERNLVLHPPWKPGTPKEPGNVIPMERTHVPVETDDALRSFTKVADALDPTKVNAALGRTADSFEGNGQEFNAALQQAAQLTENIAGQDQELLEVARNLQRLAGVVRGREQVIGTMIQNFGEVSRVLSAERGEIQELVRNILVLARKGDAIIKKYDGQLPQDLAVLTRAVLVLQGNVGSLGQLLEALPHIGGALINGYDAQNRALTIRFATDAFLRTWLKSIEGTDDIGCPLPKPNSNCPWDDGGAS
ncbi:MCE family protein [Actinomadura craniellae]|uniref:MCE family protein n=1 Tax=Actinomadura craniellae TaxID=2231787 RepID=A0A365H9S4_9ACTN|nr:MCE family protein [Actinomadura craniellae]RAY15845.1 MCE family protein [Actinomadura craniellae]